MAGAYYDAPNQQVVRADGSAPWDEGTGGSTASETSVSKEEPKADTPVSSNEPGSAEG